MYFIKEILASPIYPVKSLKFILFINNFFTTCFFLWLKREGIPQYGLIIFQENKVVFLEESASERDKQRVALLMAQNFAEIVFKKDLLVCDFNNTVNC